MSRRATAARRFSGVKLARSDQIAVTQKIVYKVRWSQNGPAYLSRIEQIAAVSRIPGEKGAAVQQYGQILRRKILDGPRNAVPILRDQTMEDLIQIKLLFLLLPFRDFAGTPSRFQRRAAFARDRTFARNLIAGTNVRIFSLSYVEVEWDLPDKSRRFHL